MPKSVEDKPLVDASESRPRGYVAIDPTLNLIALCVSVSGFEVTLTLDAEAARAFAQRLLELADCLEIKA